ncbi:MAG: GH1 family beta-glucosidase, partial [Oscillospiraceae bacterium]
MGFNKNFVWGTATASYQIEGGAFEDGRGLCVWDQFAATPGKIEDGQTGEVACDSYHKFHEDLDILKTIGVNAYRFSLSWPRLLPNGIGQMNQKGFDYYDRMIDSLLENNITPYITLFHWDFPLELYFKGGWLNRDSKYWFAEYTQKVISRYSDRVSNWITHNEPQCFIGLGHEKGVHAPGLVLPKPEVIRCWHNALAAHGEAVSVIRSDAKLKPNIAIVSCGDIQIPNTNTPEDIEACRHSAFCRDRGNYQGLQHVDLFDPVMFGNYPEHLIDFLPSYYHEDMKSISQELDYLCLNIYSGFKIKRHSEGWPDVVPDVRGTARSSTDWVVRDDSLYWAVRFINERYHKPICITENGIANNDWVSLDGKVHDPQRIDYIHRYLKSLKRACEEGYDVLGYFYWTLRDNYEWACGYKKRFGLTYIDYNDCSRILKDSAYYYHDIIKT